MNRRNVLVNGDLIRSEGLQICLPENHQLSSLKVIGVCSSFGSPGLEVYFVRNSFHYETILGEEVNHCLVRLTHKHSGSMNLLDGTISNLERDCSNE